MLKHATLITAGQVKILKAGDTKRNKVIIAACVLLHSNSLYNIGTWISNDIPVLSVGYDYSTISKALHYLLNISVQDAPGMCRIFHENIVELTLYIVILGAKIDKLTMRAHRGKLRTVVISDPLKLMQSISHDYWVIIVLTILIKIFSN